MTRQKGASGKYLKKSYMTRVLWQSESIFLVGCLFVGGEYKYFSIKYFCLSLPDVRASGHEEGGGRVTAGSGVPWHSSHVSGLLWTKWRQSVSILSWFWEAVLWRDKPWFLIVLPLLGRFSTFSSLVWRKPKSHDYVSDLVRLCLWIYNLLGVGCRELGPLWFAPAYIKYMCDWKI